MKTLTAWKSSLGLGPLLLLGLLAGCNRSDTAAAPVAAAPAAVPAVAPAAAPAPGEEYVESEPPPPQTEVIVTSPGPEYVWVGGYWGFEAGRRTWVRGRWERPPHAHATWVQPRWEHRGHGYVFVRGTWR